MDSFLGSSNNQSLSLKVQFKNLSLYFGSFLSQSGRRADKSHQLATNAAKPAKPADKFNQSRLQIKYLGCIPLLIKYLGCIPLLVKYQM